MTAKDFLAKEIDRLNELIDQQVSKASNLQLRNELMDAHHLLTVFEKYRITKKTIETIFELPNANTGYSEYRIVNDCESDNPDHWIEVNMDNKPIVLNDGDIIIKKK